MLSRPRAVLSKAFTERVIGCERGQFSGVDIGRDSHMSGLQKDGPRARVQSLPSLAHFSTHISSDNPVKGS